MDKKEKYIRSNTTELCSHKRTVVYPHQAASATEIEIYLL